MLWVMIIIFAVITVLFFLGKGSFLIAGYNTSSKQQKAMYDEKKLCRIMGIGMGVMTLSLLIAQINEDIAPYSILAGIVIGMIIIFSGNVYAKKKDYEYIETKVEKKKWYKNTKFYTSLFTVITLIGVVFVMFTGSIKITFNDKYLIAEAFLTSSTEVNYSDIQNVEYQENIETGSRTWGIGSPQLAAGKFKNEEFGKYKLYSYTKCKSYVVLKTKDGYVVFNDSSKDKTKLLYEKIQQLIQ